MPETKARRGRPPRSSKQAAASRELILQSARKLFVEEGYAGVSMRKIASLARCSPAALYILFPNKRLLLRNLWEGIFVELLMELEQVYKTSPPVERVERICDAFVDFWLRRTDDYRTIFLIEDRLEDSQDSYFAESSFAVAQLFALKRAIVESQSRGELRAGSPDEIHNILFCGLQGLAMNLITIPEYPWGDARRLKRRMIEILIAGLR